MLEAEEGDNIDDDNQKIKTRATNPHFAQVDAGQDFRAHTNR